MSDLISRKEVAEILNHQRFGIAQISWDIISEKIKALPPVEPQEDVKDILDKIMDEVKVKESPFHTVYAKGVQDGIDRCIAIIKKYRNSV